MGMTYKRKGVYYLQRQIVCALTMRHVSRWYEADSPWGDLDEDGMTEPEAVHDDDPDDDDGSDNDGGEDEADD